MIKELDGGIKGAIKRALKYGNMQYKIPCAVFDKMGYSNHEIQDLEVRNKVYYYLKKNYSKFLDSRNYELNNDGVESNEVWICWLQGIDKMPEIVFPEVLLPCCPASDVLSEEISAENHHTRNSSPHIDA